jgi:alpha-beta hydrolase superfamily lysophospholipase
MYIVISDLPFFSFFFEKKWALLINMIIIKIPLETIRTYLFPA